MKKILALLLFFIFAFGAFAEDNTFHMENLLKEVNAIERMQALDRKHALMNAAKSEAFILYSIKNMAGEEEFNKSLKNISEYGYWGSILKALDNNKLNLHNAYLKKEKILLKVSNAAYTFEKSKPAIAFSLLRNNGPEEVEVAYSLIYKNKVEEGAILSKKDIEEHFIIPVEIGEVELILDRSYKLYRQYSQEESIFNAGIFFNSTDLTLIYDKEERRKKLEESFTFKKVIDANQVKFADIKNKNIIIDGFDNPCALFFADYSKKDKALNKPFIFIKNPLGHNFNILILNDKLFKSYDDFFKYKEPNSILGIKVFKHERDYAIEYKRKTVEDFLKNSSSKVFFVGETHTAFSHHLNQLEIIDFLHKSGKKVAIALEIFPSQAEATLKSFTQGDISEAEMLRRTDYFNVWGYDYSLYAPILQYARDNKLDLVPLNISKDKIYKVASGEIDSLDKNDLPKRMKLNNEEYDRKLTMIYNMHPPKSRDENRRLEEFILSQNIWDEYMALSLYNYTSTHKDSHVVVIAGSGHLNKKSGIPLRYGRIGGEESLVIAQDSSFAETNADIFLETAPLDFQGSPKLGIISPFGSNKSVGVLIDSVEKASIAEAAGLKKKDILLKCGNYSLNNLTDLKLMLYLEGFGSKLECKVKRNNKLITKTIILERKIEKN